MKPPPITSFIAAAGFSLAVGVLPLHAGIPEDQLAFFESKIRPVLAQDCYECHSTALKQKGGLLLDSRPGWQAGGDSGDAVLPGKPNESLLIQAIRHEHPDLKMPKNGGKLDDKVIANFEAWIRMGAPDPRDTPPSKAEVARETDWHAVLERRKRESWSFQPVTHPAPPAVKNTSWSRHPVDRFVLAEIERKGLSTASPADAAVLARRLSYVITGLPPQPEEIAAFQAAALRDQDAAVREYADRLLASSRFGECWARHWMDWVRYAESHGSEGDPPIPFAWRYRDYLIRALNEDVPYPQLVKEQIAGDLLPHPRINAKEGINESALGAGQLRFVLHGFTPTDPLEEMITFTDNQIDVITKAFLGLTVSCARCHNHKFDPISQTDFYALFGILASCHPALIDVDTPDKRKKNIDELSALKPRIREAVATAWLKSLEAFPGRLESWKPDGAVLKDAPAGHSPLAAWVRLRELKDTPFRAEWQRLAGIAVEQKQQRAEFASADARLRWNAAGSQPERWFTDGNDMSKPSAAGAFTLESQGDTVIAGIHPAGLYSHLISTKHRGVFDSPRFPSEGGKIWVRVAGGDDSRIRYVAENYPRTGTVYVKQDLSFPEPKWVGWDLEYWKGDMLHVEAATNADMPLEGKDNERSWFGVTDVIYPKNPGVNPPPDGVPFHALVVDGAPPPSNRGELVESYAQTVRACIAAWSAGKMSNDEAEFLSVIVRQKLLPNSLHELPAAAPLVAEYRRLEADIPVPTRAPGVLEADPFDQPLLARGDHRQPADVVPRRFLEGIDPTAYHPKESGRLELAESLVSPKNPLASRVIVNRLWHHVFGRGLVATTDNFGRLGEAPTHPELLDYLATEFQAQGGSMKAMIRFLVTSKTFQMDSRAPFGVVAKDPDNQWLTHFPVRRLEAEAIRDTALALSGTLDERLYGPSVGAASSRRGVYLAEIRNRLDPLLTTFDAPVPTTTRGRRDATNVPAQSLALLNDPNVIRWAEDWSARTLANPSLPTDEARVRRMYLEGFGRPALDSEVKDCLAYLRQILGESESGAGVLAGLEAQIREKRSQIAEALREVREKLAKSQGGHQPDGLALEKLPEPLAEWAFDSGPDGLKGVKGRLPLELKGSARLEEGALALDGNGFAISGPLPVALREKTLEAWVKLDDLAQAGGGVMTVQMNRGDVFDAIVFAEKHPKTWVAGSNFFKRTRDFQAPPETDADERPVHIAVVYAADGSITAYRDGLAYGSAYRSDGPVEFSPAVSQVVFGLRHGEGVGGNRMLHGRILRARLYDCALTAEQIQATVKGQGVVVSDKQILAALPEDRRKQVEAQRSELKSLESQALGLRELSQKTAGRPAAWSSLAHALFNAKEFIYLR